MVSFYYALLEFRERNHADPATFQELLAVIENERQELRSATEEQKRLYRCFLFWPSWYSKHVGDMPPQWDPAKVSGHEIGAYRLLPDPGSEHVITESSSVPLLQKGRRVITRRESEMKWVRP